MRVFFEAGADVVICDRDEVAGTTLANELCGRGLANAALFVQTDVSVATQLQHAVDATVGRFGRIDCVVNNAGWHPPHKTIDDFSVDDMQVMACDAHNFISSCVQLDLFSP